MRTQPLSRKRVALQNARKAKGLTRSALAERVGVSAEHIKSLEYGRVNPSMPLMFKICAELEGNPEKLFEDFIPQK